MVDPVVTAEGTIRLDFTQRLIEGDEREILLQILEAQLPGYELADDYVPPEPWVIDVPIEAFSPPLNVLIDHYTPIAEEIAGDADDPALQQSTIDNESDLRIYPVRIIGQPVEMEPIPIIVSLRDERVVGFN